MDKQGYKFIPQNDFKCIKYPDVSTLPSETNFVYIIDSNKKVAYVETFDDEDIKIEEILKKFRIKRKYNVPGALVYKLILKTGLKIDNSKTILQLKYDLKRDSIQGLQFKIQAYKNIEKQKEYEEQCCMIDYHCKQSGSRVFVCVKITVLLKQNPKASEIMLFKINRNHDSTEIINSLLSQITNTYQNLNNLTCEEVSITKIKVSKQKGKNRQKVEKNLSLMKGRLFFDNYELEVLIVRNNVKELNRKVIKKYNSIICIYKEDQKQPQKFKYDQVANLTVQELYFHHLQLEESQKKKEAIYCLKISDMILNPDDKISKAEIYFAQVKPGVTKNVVAKVVNEKMIFYYVIPKISQRVEDQFTLDKITIPNHQNVIRQQCSRILQSRSKNASNDYFKQKKNLEPIVIYSSELVYYQNETNQELVIYQSLNKSLRQTKTLSLESQAYKKNWKLLYASTLLKHLSRIPDYKGKTYRGISFDPNYKKQHIFSIFTFKQFLSTSINRLTAVKFAMQSDALQPFHMYHFDVKTGKNIIDYSFYEEGEILIQPFTEFQLVNIKEQKFDGKRFIVYDMKERETSKKLPQIVTNFIVWIDSNPDDGKEIFDNVSQTFDSTMLIQLKSTVQFKAWTINYSDLFKTSEANIILVTNMTRKEGDKFNEYAGIEALTLARQRNKNIHAYFYIGNIDVCYDKLQAKNVSLDNIRVTNDPNQMSEFLQDQLKR